MKLSNQGINMQTLIEVIDIWFNSNKKSHYLTLWHKYICICMWSALHVHRNLQIQMISIHTYAILPFSQVLTVFGMLSLHNSSEPCDAIGAWFMTPDKAMRKRWTYF